MTRPMGQGAGAGAATLMFARRRRGIESKALPLHLTPLIDVMFQLLIYFVVTMGHLPGEGVLPARLERQADASGQARTQPISVPRLPMMIHLIAQDDDRVRIVVGHLHQGKSADDVAALTKLLSQLQHRPGQPGGIYERNSPVVIQPWGSVRWQHVVSACSAAVAAGFEQVQFAHPRQQRED